MMDVKGRGPDSVSPRTATHLLFCIWLNVLRDLLRCCCCHPDGTMTS